MFVIFTFVLLVTVDYGKCQNEQCQKGLQQNKIVPNIVKTCGGKLQVSYGTNQLSCGNKLSIFETILPPVVVFNATKYCDYATILMFDPDVPFTDGFTHWTVFNIPTGLLANGFTNNAGDTQYGYNPPLAFFGTDRYTFFLFCQKEQIKVKTQQSFIQNYPDRFLFNETKFQSSHGFNDPIACNFMYLTLFN